MEGKNTLTYYNTTMITAVKKVYSGSSISEDKEES
jgi:hypothetical protein